MVSEFCRRKMMLFCRDSRELSLSTTYPSTDPISGSAPCLWKCSTSLECVSCAPVHHTCTVQKENSSSITRREWKSLLQLLMYLPSTLLFKEKKDLEVAGLNGNKSPAGDSLAVCTVSQTSSASYRGPRVLLHLTRFRLYKFPPGPFPPSSWVTTCWLEWDWSCWETGRVQYPAPAIRATYNHSFPSCL